LDDIGKDWIAQLLPSPGSKVKKNYSTSNGFLEEFVNYHSNDV
jgi:hypothetical protein